MKKLTLAIVLLFGAHAHAEKLLQIPPSGFIRFCVSNPNMCPDDKDVSAPQERPYTQEITDVNISMNRAITPYPDPVDGTEEWHLATRQNPRGNCNTFALTKREALHNRGWSYHNLLLTAVQIPETGEYHLVLVVKTINGDFVLDNLTNEILPLASTRYRVVRMQDSQKPFNWYGCEK